ncbi:MAG: glycosyltransferase [Pirellulales bacterium]
MAIPSFKTRVLLVAPECSPNRLGVAADAFFLSSHLAEREELSLTVVTDARNRKDLRRTRLAETSRVVLVESTPAEGTWSAYLERLGQRPGPWVPRLLVDSVAHQQFELAVATKLQPEIAGGQFDLIHRLNIRSPQIPSPLASKCDVPLILGPLSQAPPWPPEFRALRRAVSDRFGWIRWFTRWQFAFLKTYRQAHAVICANQHTAQAIPKRYQGQLFRLPEHGLDPKIFPGDRNWTPPKQGPFRFVTTGNIAVESGIDLTIEALRELPSLRHVELRVIGDGAFRTEAEQLVQAAGLGDRVRFLGLLDRSNTIHELTHAHAYVAPHLCGFESAPVIDALACGLPAIVVDYGAPGQLVNPQCGIAVKMQPAETLIGELRAAMESIVQEPRRCRELSHHAIEQVCRPYSWPVLAAKVSQIYHHVLEPEVMADTAERQLAAFATGR